MECLITCEDKNLLVSGKENNIGEKRVERKLGNEICVKKYQERLSVKWQKVRVNEAMGGT